MQLLQLASQLCCCFGQCVENKIIFFLQTQVLVRLSRFRTITEAELYIHKATDFFPVRCPHWNVISNQRKLLIPLHPALLPAKSCRMLTKTILREWKQLNQICPASIHVPQSEKRLSPIYFRQGKVGRQILFSFPMAVARLGWSNSSSYLPLKVECE